MARAASLPSPLLAAVLFMACAAAGAACGSSTKVPGTDDDGGTTDDAGTSPGTDGSGPGTDAGVGTDGGSGDDASATDGAAGDAGIADTGVDVGPLSPAYVDFAINHLLVTGQSNSVANGGTPVQSTTQPYTNVSFNTGVMPMKGSKAAPAGAACDGEGCVSYDTPSSFVPLVEGDRFFNYQVETPASGIANEISYLGIQRFLFGTRPGYPAKHDVLVSVHGRSGNTYWCLRKNPCNYKPGYLAPFDQGMMEVQSGKTIAAGLGKTYVVRAVATIHGESDHYSYTDGSQEFPLTPSVPGGPTVADYSDALLEWQKDYEAGIKAITGQTIGVPLLVSQISGWNDTPVSKLANMQLDAHVRAPGKVVLVGPAYHLPLSQADCLHFTGVGSRRLGEYFAKAYARIVFEGKPWEPLRPILVTRAANVITVKFAVPVPPLVLDTTRVAAAVNSGFTYVDGSATPPTITGVALAGPDTVTVNLSATPAGANRRIRYAQNQVAGTCIGTPTGARGNLRDSDTTPSKTGAELFNWAVHFEMTVP